MKVLFIGGTGNISSECAARLHQSGHEIFVLSRGRAAVPAAYRLLQADRRDPVAMRSALEGIQPDVVLNFLGFEVSDVQLDYELFKGAIAQYIFISSATVYVKPAPRLPITEECPLGNAWWDYAQKKQACEDWLRRRSEQAGFPLTIVRPSHTYSKHWIPGIMASDSYSFAARLEQGKPVFLPDEGQNPWTLTACEDFAVGFAGLVGNSQALGEAFHITSDEALPWKQIYLEIAAAVGAQSPEIVPVPTEFICRVAPQLIGPLKGDKSVPGVFDNSKIKRVVPGFVCRKLFRTGIRESVAWLRAHPDQQKVAPKVDAINDLVLNAWRNQ